MATMTTCAANVPDTLRDAARPGLDKEKLTMSEYLRLCIAYLAEHGRAPFEVPEESRGLKNRAAALQKSVGATFFS
ncbi:hypothetical protein [Paraburkholderia graminis]|uniref:hypothetical protein n=1 Tax=Paraburkholderia graminis TaxID=60548 RepID=UPI0038B7C92A